MCNCSLIILIQECIFLFSLTSLLPVGNSFISLKMSLLIKERTSVESCQWTVVAKDLVVPMERERYIQVF